MSTRAPSTWLLASPLARLWPSSQTLEHPALEQAADVVLNDFANPAVKLPVGATSFVVPAGVCDVSAATSVAPTSVVVQLPSAWSYRLAVMAGALGNATVAAGAGSAAAAPAAYAATPLTYAAAACGSLTQAAATFASELASPSAPSAALTVEFRAQAAHTSGQSPASFISSSSSPAAPVMSRIDALPLLQSTYGPCAAQGGPGQPVTATIPFNPPWTATAAAMAGRPAVPSSPGANTGSTLMYAVVRDADGGVGIAWATVAITDVAHGSSVAHASTATVTALYHNITVTALTQAVFVEPLYAPFTLGAVIGSLIAATETAREPATPDVTAQRLAISAALLCSMATGARQLTIAAGTSVSAAASSASSSSVAPVCDDGCAALTVAGVLAVTDSSWMMLPGNGSSPTQAAAARCALDATATLLRLLLPPNVVQDDAAVAAALAGVAPVAAPAFTPSAIRPLPQSVGVGWLTALLDVQWAFAASTGRFRSSQRPGALDAATSAIITSSVARLGAALLRGSSPGFAVSVRAASASNAAGAASACGPALALAVARVDPRAVAGSSQRLDMSQNQLEPCGGSVIVPPSVVLPAAFIATATGGAALPAVDIQLVQWGAPLYDGAVGWAAPLSSTALSAPSCVSLMPPLNASALTTVAAYVNALVPCATPTDRIPSRDIDSLVMSVTVATRAGTRLSPRVSSGDATLFPQLRVPLADDAQRLAAEAIPSAPVAFRVTCPAATARPDGSTAPPLPAAPVAPAIVLPGYGWGDMREGSALNVTLVQATTVYVTAQFTAEHDHEYGAAPPNLGTSTSVDGWTQPPPSASPLGYQPVQSSRSVALFTLSVDCGPAMAPAIVACGAGMYGAAVQSSCRPPVVSPLCGWWDTGRGEWSTDGCHVVSADGVSVTCACTHLTDFAARYTALGASAQVVFASSVLVPVPVALGSAAPLLFAVVFTTIALAVCIGAFLAVVDTGSRRRFYRALATDAEVRFLHRIETLKGYPFVLDRTLDGDATLGVLLPLSTTTSASAAATAAQRKQQARRSKGTPAAGGSASDDDDDDDNDDDGTLKGRVRPYLRLSKRVLRFFVLGKKGTLCAAVSHRLRAMASRGCHRIACAIGIDQRSRGQGLAASDVNIVFDGGSNPPDTTVLPDADAAAGAGDTVSTVTIVGAPPRMPAVLDGRAVGAVGGTGGDNGAGEFSVTNPLRVQRSGAAATSLSPVVGVSSSRAVPSSDSVVVTNLMLARSVTFNPDEPASLPRLNAESRWVGARPGASPASTTTAPRLFGTAPSVRRLSSTGTWVSVGAPTLTSLLRAIEARGGLPHSAHKVLQTLPAAPPPSSSRRSIPVAAAAASSSAADPRAPAAASSSFASPLQRFASATAASTAAAATADSVDDVAATDADGIDAEVIIFDAELRSLAAGRGSIDAEAAAVYRTFVRRFRLTADALPDAAAKLQPDLAALDGGGSTAGSKRRARLRAAVLETRRYARLLAHAVPEARARALRDIAAAVEHPTVTAIDRRRFLALRVLMRVNHAEVVVADRSTAGCTARARALAGFTARLICARLLAFHTCSSPFARFDPAASRPARLAVLVSSVFTVLWLTAAFYGATFNGGEASRFGALNSMQLGAVAILAAAVSQPFQALIEALVGFASEAQFRWQYPALAAEMGKRRALEESIAAVDLSALRRELSVNPLDDLVGGVGADVTVGGDGSVEVDLPTPPKRRRGSSSDSSSSDSSVERRRRRREATAARIAAAAAASGAVDTAALAAADAALTAAVEARGWVDPPRACAAHCGWLLRACGRHSSQRADFLARINAIDADHAAAVATQLARIKAERRERWAMTAGRLAAVNRGVIGAQQPERPPYLDSDLLSLHEYEALRATAVASQARRAAVARGAVRYCAASVLNAILSLMCRARSAGGVATARPLIYVRGDDGDAEDVGSVSAASRAAILEAARWRHGSRASIASVRHLEAAEGGVSAGSGSAVGDPRAITEGAIDRDTIDPDVPCVPVDADLLDPTVATPGSGLSHVYYALARRGPPQTVSGVSKAYDVCGACGPAWTPAALVVYTALGGLVAWCAAYCLLWGLYMSADVTRSLLAAWALALAFAFLIIEPAAIATSVCFSALVWPATAPYVTWIPILGPWLARAYGDHRVAGHALTGRLENISLPRAVGYASAMPAHLAVAAFSPNAAIAGAAGGARRTAEVHRRLAAAALPTANARPPVGAAPGGTHTHARDDAERYELVVRRYLQYQLRAAEEGRRAALKKAAAATIARRRASTGRGWGWDYRASASITSAIRVADGSRT